MWIQVDGFNPNEVYSTFCGLQCMSTTRTSRSGMTTDIEDSLVNPMLHIMMRKLIHAYLNVVQ